MTITRQTLGRILGLILLVALILGLSYLVMAFVTWEANPGRWDPFARTCAIGVGIALILARLFASRINVIDGDVKE